MLNLLTLNTDKGRKNAAGSFPVIVNPKDVNKVTGELQSVE